MEKKTLERKTKEERIGQLSAMVCDVGECLRKDVVWGVQLGAEEHTVIHTSLYHRCSLLLLFLCSLICSPHQKLCWVILGHLCIFREGRKRSSGGISEIYSVDFRPGWWEPMRLMDVRASHPRASECTGLFVPFSFLSLGGSVVETKPGLALNYSSLYKTGPCHGWLHLTRRSWLPSECKAEAGWHDTSLFPQTRAGPGPSVMQRLVINLILKVKICHLFIYQSMLKAVNTCASQIISEKQVWGFISPPPGPLKRWSPLPWLWPLQTCHLAICVVRSLLVENSWKS